MRYPQMDRRTPWTALALALFLVSCGGGGPRLEIAGEHVPADEAETIQGLIDATKESLEEEYPPGETLRFNQPRHPGCVRAEFSVEPDLAADLLVGLFAEPATYPTWIRFANASNEPDTEKDFRGMSLKVIGVSGTKLLGDGEAQDFVLNSHPVLFVGTAQDFLKFIERGRILFFFNPFDLHIKSLRIAMAGRKHHPSHLTIPYWSTTPYLFGEGKAVKYSARPCGGSVEEEREDPTDGYLREAMRRQLSTGGSCFEFLVQFQTDPEAMPVEDATVEWDEADSPFRKVATVRIPPQEFTSDAQMRFCENLAFNPWHSLAEHRPLGGLNRARKQLYRELADFRHERNGVIYTEPTGDERF